MKHPKVSITILNWNGLEDTTECLESLKKVTYPNYEVIVVDNCSDGDDARILKEKFGDYIQVIQNDKNYGCGQGFNTGIQYALKNYQPDYVMIMNNDVVVDPAFLDELVKVAESDELIGIVGPKIYYYDYSGRKDVIWSAGGRIRWWTLRVHTTIGENDDDLPKYQAIKNVDWITGAVAMFRSSMTKKVGLLNPWYFIGHEDVEYCLKARKHGFNVVYVPTAKAWHKVGASVKKTDIIFPGPSSYYYLLKHSFPSYVYIYHLLLLPALLSRWALIYLTQHRDRQTIKRFLFDFPRLFRQSRGKRL